MAETGESEVFCHADLRDLPVREADYGGYLSPVIDAFTQYYARTDDMHDGDEFAANVPG